MSFVCGMAYYAVSLGIGGAVLTKDRQAGMAGPFKLIVPSVMY